MPQLLPPTRADRAFAVSTLVNSVGSGIYLTAGVLYFTQVAHLPASQVGIGLSTAGLVSLTAGATCGSLADRRDARTICIATLLARAAATAGFALARGFWPFLAVVTLAASAQAAGLAARGPILRQHGGDRPQRLRAYLRAVTNIGIAVGALLAGAAVQRDTGAAYQLLVLGNAVAFAGAAAFMIAVPRVPPVSPGRASPRIALADRPYLLITALAGVMDIQYRVLSVALPLWLVNDTTAPRWVISATMFLSTAIVVCLQVPASRHIDSPATAGRAYRRAGLTFLVSCSLLPLSSYGAPVAATAIILAGTAVHTIGELWQAAAGFELSFALAPTHATGQYQGVFGMGGGLADAIAPYLLVTLCITWGTAGWYALGALFALTGLLVPVAVRHATTAVRNPDCGGNPGEPVAGAASDSGVPVTRVPGRHVPSTTSHSTSSFPGTTVSPELRTGIDGRRRGPVTPHAADTMVPKAPAPMPKILE